MEAHLDDDQILLCTLIELTIGVTVYRTCDWSRDVIWNGNTYSHTAPYDLAQVVTDSDGPQASSVAWDDEGQQVMSTDDAYGLGERSLAIYVALIDPTNIGSALAAQPIVQGRTENAAYKVSDTRLIANVSVITTPRSLTAHGLRTRYQTDCSNEYSDARCKHVGNRCNQTYASCFARANTINFRGLRYAEQPQVFEFNDGVIRLNTRSYE
jgi:hypothetical protein